MKNDANYLIEYRFQGSSKHDIREMILHLTNKFHLHYAQPRKPVPHISLVGGFSTTNEKQLVKDFTSYCAATPFCRFTVKGFSYFDTTRVIFIDIKPDDTLKQFRWNLSRCLAKYCSLKGFDYREDFAFHATLALHLEENDFFRVKRYIDNQPEPQFTHYVLRATLLRNGKIFYEYDFLQRRLLNRNEALDKRELTRTFHLLDEFFKGNYNPDSKLRRQGYPIVQKHDEFSKGNYDPNSNLRRQDYTNVQMHDSEGIIHKIVHFFKSILHRT